VKERHDVYGRYKIACACACPDLYTSPWQSAYYTWTHFFILIDKDFNGKIP